MIAKTAIILLLTAIPIYFANAELVMKCQWSHVSVDGDLSDWEGIPCIELNGEDQIAYHPKKWNGTNDLSARVYSAYDDQNLYFGFNVNDNILCNRNAYGYFHEGDCVEIFMGFDENHYFHFFSCP